MFPYLRLQVFSIINYVESTSVSLVLCDVVLLFSKCVFLLCMYL